MKKYDNKKQNNLNSKSIQENVTLRDGETTTKRRDKGGAERGGGGDHGERQAAADV